MRMQTEMQLPHACWPPRARHLNDICKAGRGMKVYIHPVSLQRDLNLTEEQVQLYKAIVNNNQTAMRLSQLGRRVVRFRWGVVEPSHPDGWMYGHWISHLGEENIVQDFERADICFLPIWDYALCTAVGDLGIDLKTLNAHQSQTLFETCSRQVQLYRWLFQQPAWQRSHGADHVFFRTYKDRLSRSGRKAPKDNRTRSAGYAIVANSILVTPEDRHADVELRRGCTTVVVPYWSSTDKWGMPLNSSFEQMRAQKGQLISFIGNRKGKKCHLEYTPKPACPKNSGPDLAGHVRSMLLKSLSNSSASSRTAIELNGKSPAVLGDKPAAALIRTVFCPCPLGDSYTTKRLFTAVLSMCIPIIISDRIQLPFPDAIPWTDMVLQVPEDDIRLGKVDIVKFAQEVPPARVLRLQHALWSARPKVEYAARRAGDATDLMIDELQQARSCMRPVLVQRLGVSSCMHGVTFGLEPPQKASASPPRLWVLNHCEGLFTLFVNGRVCLPGVCEEVRCPPTGTRALVRKQFCAVGELRGWSEPLRAWKKSA